MTYIYIAGLSLIDEYMRCIHIYPITMSPKKKVDEFRPTARLSRCRRIRHLDPYESLTVLNYPGSQLSIGTALCPSHHRQESPEHSNIICS